jgi:uncharacterized protein YwgA
MKRLQKAVILADLTDRMRDHGSWCGETHIQKAVYFLQELFKVPLGYRYMLYKHGPFSFDLRDAITEFRVYDIFKLEPRQVPYGPSLRTTRNVETLKGHYPKTLSNYGRHISFVAKTLGGKGVASLERLATALYVSLEDKSDATEDRAVRIHDLKPHVSLDSARNALKEFDEMRQSAEKLLAGIEPPY